MIMPFCSCECAHEVIGKNCTSHIVLVCWCPTRNDLKKLWSAQLAMLRKIVRVRPRPLEDMAIFMPRSVRTCVLFMESVKAVRWDFRAHLYISRFAGHVARIKSYDQGRLTVESLHWRNQEWIDLVAASNGGRQLHCRRLKVWRWERTLVKYFGRDWEEQAMDKIAWDALLHDYANWQSTVRGR